MCICDSFPVKDFNSLVCHRTSGHFLVVPDVIVAKKCSVDKWLVVNGAWTFTIVDRNHIRLCYDGNDNVRQANYVFLNKGDYERCGVEFIDGLDYGRVLHAASKVAHLVLENIDVR